MKIPFLRGTLPVLFAGLMLMVAPTGAASAQTADSAAVAADSAKVDSAAAVAGPSLEDRIKGLEA